MGVAGGMHGVAGGTCGVAGCGWKSGGRTARAEEHSARLTHMAARAQGASGGTKMRSRACTAGNILTGSEKKIESDMKSFAHVPT